MNLSNLELAFIISSIFIYPFFIWIAIAVYKSNADIKKSFIKPLMVAIVVLPVCVMLYVIKNYISGMLLETAYFIGTIWLALFMLYLSFDYCDIEYRKFKTMRTMLDLSCAADSISLIVNLWTHHSFNLSLETTMRNGAEHLYWSLHLTPYHWIHLGFCYLMVTSTFITLVAQIVKAPYFYKKKYAVVTITYGFVIILNFISYMMDLPVDISPLLYLLLAGFIAAYSIYIMPKQLVFDSLKKYYETIEDGLICYDNSNQCLFANKRAQAIFGTSTDLINKTAELYLQEWISTYGNESTDHNMEITFTTDGIERHFYVEYKRLNVDERNIGSYLRFMDRTKEISQHKQEEFRATHDELTGILNREHFFESCNNTLRTMPDEERLMICSNIKDFKLVNEIFGQQKGDEVLITQANLMKQFAREGSVYGRIGDDKFAMLIPKARYNQELFLNAIQRLAQVTESSVFKMHIFVGICEAHGPELTAQQLYDRCLMAIDSISNDYQKIFAYYDSELMDKILVEKNIISEFENALEDNQFKMFLQPIVDDTGTILGAEALSRWVHPQSGILPPSAFFDILEKKGLVHKLDAFIWEQAAKKLVEWRERGIEDKYISVNVSPKDIYYTDIYNSFETLKEKYSLNPHLLKIEFTEAVLTEDFKKSVQIFERLQQSGFQIAIDDFGSGYSSLNLLKDIKADILKIDAVFLRDTVNQERNKTILEFIISISKELNMPVITEGIESSEKIQMLRELGCNKFQGYYFSKPLSSEEFDRVFFSNRPVDFCI